MEQEEDALVQVAARASEKMDQEDLASQASINQTDELIQKVSEKIDV